MSDELTEDGPRLVLGPDEIVNYELRKQTRGYAVKEVDDLLDQLAVQTKDLLVRVEQAEQDLDQLHDELAEASEAESMLKRTLLTAQRAAEASVAEAREEAEEMRGRTREAVQLVVARAAEEIQELREAALRRARADEADIRTYRRDVEKHVAGLRTFAEDHHTRLRHHLDRQQERLDELDLPEPPSTPERVSDDVVDVEFEDVEVDRIVADLLGASVETDVRAEEAASEWAEVLDEVGSASQSRSDPGGQPVEPEEPLFDEDE